QLRCSCCCFPVRCVRRVLVIFLLSLFLAFRFFFFQAEDGIRDFHVTGVQTCALPIWARAAGGGGRAVGRGRGVADGGSAGASGRSEERRVGKECRDRWSRDQ